jgi:serine/threonine-protein kinase
VSLNTQSFVILTDGANPQTINVSEASPSCQKINDGESLSCKIGIRTTAGVRDFTVTSYGQPNGQGAALSTNSTGPIFVKAGANTPIAITLQGIVAAATLTLQNAHPPAGAPLKIPLTVVLKDASGAIIVGPAPLDAPFSVFSSDVADGPLSKTTIYSPADESGITADYDGADIEIIYTPSIGLSDAALTPVPPKVRASKIYIANTAGLGILTYNADGTPGSPTITDGVTDPSGVAVDTGGNIYVANSFFAGMSGAVTTYNPDGSRRSLTIPFGVLSTGQIAVDLARNIYVCANDPNDVGYVLSWDSQGAQPKAPVELEMESTLSVAVYAAGTLYVTLDSFAFPPDNTVRTYVDGGQTSPFFDFGATIPSAVAVDAAGKIYIALGSANRILTYNPDGTPTSPTITAGLAYPEGIAVDGAGTIYVANARNDTVTTYNADGSRSAPTIALPYNPVALAVH